MKHFFAKKIRMAAYNIRSKVHQQFVVLSMSRISSPWMALKYKWYTHIHNISESLFYKCDSYCCRMNGCEPFIF